MRFPLSNEVNTTKSDSSVKVYIMTEQASTSKEKADEVVDKRGKTKSVVWKWFVFFKIRSTSGFGAMQNVPESGAD